MIPAQFPFFLSFHDSSIRKRIPKFSQRTWRVYRKQYYVGQIRWDAKRRVYLFCPDACPESSSGFDEDELSEISRFLRTETTRHRGELSRAALTRELK